METTLPIPKASETTTSATLKVTLGVFFKTRWGVFAIKEEIKPFPCPNQKPRDNHWALEHQITWLQYH